MTWWLTHKFAEKRPFLERRTALIRSVRGWFDAQDFWEVETPILQVSPVMDAHIHAFSSIIKGVDLEPQGTLYLHTSPEFAMKKLLAAGVERSYQTCHVFRNAEGSRLHSPEFTLLEWYRAHSDYRAMMADCEGLLRHCARALGITHYRHRGHACDPFAPWDYVSVAEAFDRYAHIDLGRYLEDTDAFRAVLRARGLHTAVDDRWDDLFFRVMGEWIEPNLGMTTPTILHDFPRAMASLSREKRDDPRYAERFEMFVCGIELCNAFSELTDPVIQRERFVAEMAAKQTLYGETYPIDEDFLAALPHMPESSGNALGIDRLAMLATGADDIDLVLWAGKPQVQDK